MDTKTQQPMVVNDLFLQLNTTEWTGIYTIATIIGTIFIVFSALIAIAGMSRAREINKENNEIQKDRVLQERLIELSHEWNSKDFICARNKAALLMKEFEGRVTSAYSVMSENRRLDDWIYISMIAHFFERLSYIQLSKQIYRKNAVLEFGEAIEYWYDFLYDAYFFDKENESRMRKALKALRDEYRKSESESGIP